MTVHILHGINGGVALLQHAALLWINISEANVSKAILWEDALEPLETKQGFLEPAQHMRSGHAVVVQRRRSFRCVCICVRIHPDHSKIGVGLHQGCNGSSSNGMI